MNRLEKLKAAIQRVESGGSPLEKKFLGYLDAIKIYNYVRELEVAGYFIDIAIPDKKIAIELDGKMYHSSEEQKAHDKKKDEVLEGLGWKVLRFNSQDVWGHVGFGNALLRIFNEVYKDTSARPPFIIAEILGVEPRSLIDGAQAEEEPEWCERHNCFFADCDWVHIGEEEPRLLIED